MRLRAFDRNGTVTRFNLSPNLRREAAIHAVAKEIAKARGYNFHYQCRISYKGGGFFVVWNRETNKLAMLVEKEA